MNRLVVLTSVLVLTACSASTSGVGGEDDTAGDTATETQAGTDETDDNSGGESGEESAGEESGGGASCGNGLIEVDEDCDGDNLAGQSCEDFGFVGGELGCSDDCTLDATNCTEELCGNGIREGEEECDGQDFGGVNCTDLGFGPGLPLCADDCSFDTSTCPTLGEGEMCSFLDPCPDDLNCVSGICYDGSPGDPCENDWDCQSGDCDGNTFVQDGTCV